MDARLHARWLGAAYLVVVATSLVSGLLYKASSGSGTTSQVLANLAGNAGMARISVAVAMLNCAAIVALASLLYVVLANESRVIALIGLACWVGEAIFYAVAWVAVAGLTSLGAATAASVPTDPATQTLATFLSDTVYGLSQAILMFFYCVGGIAWYGLLYRSQLVPRVLAGYGLAAVGLGLVGTLIEFLGSDVPMIVYLTILPFELVIGVWLLVKGVQDRPAGSPTSTPELSGRIALGTG